MCISSVKTYEEDSMKIDETSVEVEHETRHQTLQKLGRDVESKTEVQNRKHTHV